VKRGRAVDAIVVLLAASAGWLDAATYLHVHVFVANMTGNTVLFALGLGHESPGNVPVPLTAIASFVLGAFASTALTERGTSSARASSRAFFLEAAMLALFSALWYVYAATAVLKFALIAVGAFAMGVQQATTERLHPKPEISTTYQSGTVERLGIGLYKALRGDRRTLVFNGVVWLVYAASALCGVELAHYDAHVIGIVPFAAVLAVGVVLLLLREP
jgi:uncharacterized membrane protein YoaK (UPF0700 family)